MIKMLKIENFQTDFKLKIGKIIKRHEIKSVLIGCYLEKNYKGKHFFKSQIIFCQFNNIIKLFKVA